ncbi:uncharacterized protein LOC141595064 [Silene latifolia]|uniref:uncharacterized protein LOC141595064 n=1 Tax=Silene latifolia TaxID=37657 RepID=UPI003D781F1F
MEANAISDWNTLALAFYKRYFTSQKTNALRSQITSFKQGPTKDLNEAWVRFKRLVRSVPHHGFQIWFLCNQFYNGLYDDHRALLDSSANGRFQNNTTDANAWKLIDEIATHTTEYGNPRGTTRGGSSYGVVVAQLEALTAQIAELKTTQYLGKQQKVQALVQQEVPCERCGTNGHVAAGCMSTIEQVHAYQSLKQGSPYSNFNNVQNPTPPPPMRMSFLRIVVQPPPQASNNDMSDIKAMLQQQMAASQKQEALINQLLDHNKILDNQVAKLSSQNSSRQSGALPSQLDKPHETVNATNPRRDFTYDRPEMPKDDADLVIEESNVNDKIADSLPIADDSTSSTAKKSNADKVKKAAEPPIVIKLLFPTRQLHTKLEQQFGKFIKLVKNLQVSIPFTELITQVPSYAKFMKEILTRKRSFDEVETIAFTEECSALLQNKSPPKLADPGSFSIPCSIGTHTIDNALCDLGASVSVLPLSLAKMIGLTEFKCTNMTVQMANEFLGTWLERLICIFGIPHIILLSF